MQSLSYGKNAVWNYGGILVLSLTTIMAAPIFIHYMGVGGFGLFRLTIYSIVSFAFLLELGASAALKRIIGISLNRKNFSEAKTTIIFGFVFFLVLSVLSIFAAFHISPALAKFLSVNEADTDIFNELIKVSGIYLGLLFVQTPLNALSVAIGRFDYIQIPQMSLRILQLLILPVMVAFSENATLAGGCATLIAGMLSLLLSCYLPRRELCLIFRQGRFQPSLAIVKEFFKLSGYSLIIAATPVLLYYGADVAVARYHGAASVAFFAIATIVATQVRILIAGALSPGFSHASKMAAAEDMGGLGGLVNDLLRYGIFAWVFFSLPLILFSEPIISVWVGEEFSYYWRLTVIQLLGVAGVALYLSIYTVMNAMGRLSGMAVISFLCVCAAISVLYLTGENGRSSLEWIALCIAGSLLLRGGLCVLYASSIFGAHIYSHLANIALKSLAIFFMTISVHQFLRIALAGSPVAYLVIGFPFITMCNFIFCCLVFLNREERSIVKRKLDSIGNKLIKKELS